jgi:hypothetical protein
VRRQQNETAYYGTIRVLGGDTTSTGCLARGKFQEARQDEKKPQLIDIKGTVRSENAKITFVADEGGKSWDVINPEVLKDHVDHHIQVSVHVYADKGQTHVMTVVMI